MSGSSTLRNAKLNIQVGFLDIPLESLFERQRKPEQALITPKIAPPDLGDSLEVEPVEALALQELIRQADSGRVRVSIPLPKKKLAIGPMSIDLSAGHAAVIELEVDTARVLRKKTKGTIEPPIPLPLGLTFVGLYLNEHGEVIADIAGFPDVNLARWSRQVPQIPSTLDGVLDLLFPGAPETEAEEGEGATEGKEAPKEEKEEDFDLSGLTVEARAVRPRCAEALHLGSLGEVMLGPKTEIDVEYGATELVIRGHFHVDRALLEGKGFRLEGVSLEGDAEWRLFGPEGAKEMSLTVTGASAQIERAEVTVDGGSLLFSASTLDDVAVRFNAGADPDLAVEVGHLTSELVAGTLFFDVGDAPVRAELTPMRAAGTLAFAQGRLTFDLGLDGVGLRVPQATADLGLVRVDVTELAAVGRGRVSGATDGAVAFSGSLEAQADVASSHLLLGQLGATLAPGSRAKVGVTEIEADRGGLRALIASAELDLKLRSGSVPLGADGAVRFSEGAEGVLVLETVALTKDQRWPYVEGQVRIDARSDPVSIDELVDLSRGNGHVSARVTLDPGGHLCLSDLELDLTTE